MDKNVKLRRPSNSFACLSLLSVLTSARNGIYKSVLTHTVMDEDLKNPVVDATKDRVQELPAADPDQIRQLVTEALSENTELARLRELNKLIVELVTRRQEVASKEPGPSVETLISMRRTLRQTVLDSYKEEYKELSDLWKSLETKAQGTVTIAGIFIAAAFTFAKDLTSTRLDFCSKLFLAVAILLLIPTVILSVLALRRRTIRWIPAGADVEQIADHIEDVPNEDLADRARRFIDEHSGIWKQTVESTREATTRKEELLNVAQILLLFAIGAATIVTLRVLYL